VIARTIVAHALKGRVGTATWLRRATTCGRRIRLPWVPLVVVAALAVALDACERNQLPTGLQPAPGIRADSSPVEVSLNAHGLAYPSAGDPYVCFTSVAMGNGTYRYGRISLHFPAPALAVDGAKHLYIYGGRDSTGAVVFIAECAIPATRTAVSWMNRRFEVVELARNPLAVGHAPPPGEGVSTMGCVSDGECELEPITVTVSPLPVDNCNVMGCSTEGGGAGGGDIAGGGGTATGSTSGPGSPMPDDSTSVDDAGSCPDILSGKVITALIPVAGSNHQFDFDGRMTKIPGTSPARYNVNPTVSSDGQWMATQGWITVSCVGAYTPPVFGVRLWIGNASYAGASDLHMIYGPQHPSF
jgi:hypothetical protein